MRASANRAPRPPTCPKHPLRISGVSRRNVSVVPPNSADLRYISVGNLSYDDRIALFFIDFSTQQRLKLYGHAHVVEDGDIVERLAATADRGRVERAVVIDLVAATWNCRQHIPLLFRAADVEAAMRKQQERIDELERQLSRGKSAT